MKFNWGTGIAIFYTCFVIAMISMVVKSFSYQSHLVKEDYYQLDLDYEEYRIKRQNANQLTVPIDLKYNNKTNSIDVTFPSSMQAVSGDLHLFRPSNKYLDQRFPMRIDSLQTMSVILDKQLLGGLWKVKLDWVSNGIPYYQEVDLVI